MEIRVKRLSRGAILPHYAHCEDSGLDLHASESVSIGPSRSALVRTGIAVALPLGTEGQIRPLSGMALSSSVTVLNSPGTIDEGFRGEICVLLINHGLTVFRVEKGMRIGQLVVQKRWDMDVVEVDYLEETERGESGFGSTDRCHSEE